jgi:hypothetical protein
MTRSEPTITVTCDECGDEVQVGLTALGRRAYDERIVDQHLEGQGWGKPSDDDSLDLCSDCMKDLIDDDDD